MKMCIKKHNLFAKSFVSLKCIIDEVAAKVEHSKILEV